MKRIIFVIAVLMAAFTAYGQITTSTGANHIEIQYPDGDTAFVGTGSFAGLTLYMESGNEIFVIAGGNFQSCRGGRRKVYTIGDTGAEWHGAK